MKNPKEKENLFNLVFITLLGFLLFFPPFFSGLFFDVYWLPYQTAIGICAVTFLVFKRSDEGNIALELLDFTNAALLLGYILSVFAAVNVQGAISEALKISTYFLLFILISHAVASVKDIFVILKSFYWSGMVVSLISIGTAFGSYMYPSAFIGGRMYSTLEYPNTFAAYTICLLVIGLYFAEKSPDQIKQTVYSITNFWLLVGFFGAMSRGGLLTLVTVLIIYFVGLPREYRAGLIIKTVFSAVIAYLFINYIFSPLPVHSPVYYWVSLAAASLLSILPNILRNTGFHLTILNKKRNLIIYTAVGLILLGLITGLAKGIFPESVGILGTGQAAGRFSTISVSSVLAQERFVFYQDALKIIRDYPLLGAGGRGWNALYQRYQGYNYITSEVHNHFLQVWVESGTLGLLAFLSIWAAATVTAVNLLKKVKENGSKLLVWSVFCAALALGIHSLMDFNLSIPAMAILLWGLFGCLRAFQRIIKQTGPVWQIRLPLKVRAFKIAAGVFLGGFLFMSVFFQVSLNYGEKAGGQLSEGSGAAAAEELKKAVAINPWASNYLAVLAETLILQDSAQPQDLQNAQEYINRAIRLESYNPDYRLIHGQILWKLGRIDQAVQEFEEAGRLSPYEQKYVDRLAEMYYAAGRHYFMINDKPKARIYLTKAVDYQNLIAARINGMEPRYKKLQRPELALVVSKPVETAKSMAAVLLAKV